jgi:hypothetical protein
MASDKAKENKALTAVCEVCNQATSTELMVSLPGRDNGRPRWWTVCFACANKGWRPPGFTGVYTVRVP